MYVHLYSPQMTEQESLANAKVSARQPEYTGQNSLNHPSLALFAVQWRIQD